MKNWKVNTTVDRGNKAQNISLTIRAKSFEEAKALAKGHLEAHGREVVTQWRGVA